LNDAAPRLLATQHFPLQPAIKRKVVSAFYPSKSEIDARPLFGKLAGEGWTTYLPFVIALDQPLIFRRWMPGQPTTPGLRDFPQPTDDAELVELDVLLVPTMVFDGCGLSYGSGFYDRTLEVLRAKKTIKAIGVAYSAQEVNSVPHDAHDQILDYVLTEKFVFKLSP
jgi:5-formyltetrahydrofolate cyclo-ligase